MTTIFLVRHGRAASAFDAHADPGLDASGQRQAHATARFLARFGPMPIYSSPLARARETALPLVARWGLDAKIEPRVAEIPSPTADLAARGRWLAQAMQGRWRDLSTDLASWRTSLVDCLLEMREDSIVYCHFVAINVAVGAARDDDRMVHFRPDYGSVTRIAVADGRLRIVELGREASTLVG